MSTATIQAMGVVQLNQIKNRVLESVGQLVDVSDAKPDQVDVIRLTRGLAAWVIAQASECSFADAAESVIDGFGDNGVDAVFVDSPGSLVYLVQSKWSQTGKGSPALGDVHKFLQGVRDIINAEFDRFNDKARAKQHELEAALSDPNVKFALIVAHTGPDALSEPAMDAVQGLLQELNDPIETATFDVFSQVELHGRLSRGIQGQSPDLQVALYDWGSTQEPYAAYYGQVEASSVGEWYSEHSTRLFSKNIRQFLGQDSEVNASIAETLKANPSHFWYLNNGITVLCERVAKSALGGSNKKVGQFEFTGVSVVNGAQTVGCIGEAMAEDPGLVADARVTVRFISLENCPPEFAAEVTRGTNTQNRVERRDFVALDPEQGRLVTELAIDNVHYAIKSGEPTPSPDRGCTVIDATVALACAQSSAELAVQAKREIGRLWIGAEDGSPGSLYRRMFNSKLSGERLWRSVRVLRGIESALEAERSLRQGRERLIGVHGNRLMAHQVFQLLPSDSLSDANSEFDKTLLLLPGLVKAVYTGTVEAIAKDYSANYLASLFKNATRCKALVSQVSAGLSPIGAGEGDVTADADSKDVLSH